MKYILFAALAGLVLPLSAEMLCNRPFQSEGDLKGIYNFDRKTMRILSLKEGGRALEIQVPEEFKEAKNLIAIHLPGERIRNTRLSVSAEIKCDMGNPVSRWGGGQFVVWAPAPRGKKGGWEHRYVGAGKSGWKTYRMELDVHGDVSHALLHLGISGARGRILYRNVKVETEGVTLPLESFANMGFADETAGDGRGGWHDQGADYDASSFPVKEKKFANVPFRIVNPKENGGKAILVFECPRLPRGIREAKVELNTTYNGKYLYLLHCSAWGQKNGTPAGTIILEGENGKTAELPVIYGRDLVEWWGAKPGENAVVGVQIAAKGGLGAAYVSRFDIPRELGRIRSVVFRKKPGANVMWMLIGATISDTAFRYPEARKLVMKEDEVWKALPQRYPPVPKAGSALDVSVFYPHHTAGEFGRVVIGKSGHFEFEKRPGVPVRFFSACMGREFGSFFGAPVEMKDKAMIERYADQIQRAGYNMVRFWASVLKDTDYKNNKAFQFSSETLDKVDYFFSCLKKRGIYVFLSIQIATIGVDAAYPWGDPRLKDWNLYRNKRDFDNWCRSAEMVLLHVNPYTGTRWIDDPQIAMIDCNNEQEFAFLRADNRYAPLFREYLRKKYGTFSALKQAWGNDASSLKSFEDIRTFHPLGMDKAGQLNRDRAEFVTGEERSLYERERAWLRKLGWKGPVTSFLMGKSMRHAGVRKEFDFVAQNGYHAHPSGGTVTTGGRVAQISSIGSAANIIRSFIAARLYAKPFIVTEHGHTFWNRYRYEQGFVMGGLAALNAFDGLTAFFMPVTTHPSVRMTSFEIRHDPVSRASEIMTNLLFRRGDVRSSGLVTRISMNLDDVIASGAVTDGINSSQLRMGLIGQCHVDQTSLPVGKNEVRMTRTGGSGTAVRSADSNVVDSGDSAFDMPRLIASLKKRNLLPQSNRTDPAEEMFESSTGEVYLDCGKKFMQIDTPRFQGICGTAGTSAELSSAAIRSMNRDACIAFASIDGNKNLKEAERILLIISTNVLNSGMSFENADQQTRINPGTVPLLLETGTFSLALKQENASRMKLYALALDGSRIDEIPVRKIEGGIEFTIDTAKIRNGPSIYFELE